MAHSMSNFVNNLIVVILVLSKMDAAGGCK